MSRQNTWSRRRFLAGLVAAPLLSACAGGGQPAASTAAPAKPTEPAAPAPKAAEKPSAATGGALKVLVRSHFVPAFDTWLDKWTADWAAKNRVEVTVDHILAGELPAKWAAEVAANAGHDLFGFTQGGAINVYDKQLVDLSDVAAELGKKHGDWVEPLASQLGRFAGVWKGVPDYFVDFPVLYRKDLFDANGMKPVDTWEELLKAGAVLKGKGNPVGIAINQKSNDSNNSWHSLLWGYGVSYASQEGKLANFNTPETKEALKVALELYQKTMTDEVLSWDDTGNNQGLLSGRLCWIQNPISALRTVEKEKPDLAKNIAVSNPPAGPKGRYASCSTSVLGLMSWSQSAAAAKAFIADYFAAYADGVKASQGYNQPLLRNFRKKPMPVLGEDPRLTMLQDFDQVARVVGHPGPPTPAAAEVESNWIIPLTVGRAVQGNVDDAVSWAGSRIEQIYKKHNLA
jgi:multiple sugar transport system substrate-binding protein